MNNENFHVDGIGGIQIQLADARGSALPCPRHIFADKVVCSNSAMGAARSISAVDILSGGSSMCVPSFLSKLSKVDYRKGTAQSATPRSASRPEAKTKFGGL